MNEHAINVAEYKKVYDVVVAGGGLTGVCAAVAAAREGASVLLLEATGALGGMATQGLVPGWCGVHNKEEVVHSALSQKIMRESWPESDEFDCAIRVRPIKAELLKRVCDEMVEKSGSDLLFNTTVSGAEKSGEHLQAVYIANKAGISAVKAKIFIDCTGDADLAAWAGVPFESGDEDGELQPVSHCYSISGIDENKLAQDLKQTPDWSQKMIDDPDFPLIKDSYIGLGSRVETSFRTFNSGHLWDVDNTDPENLTNALIDGRKLADQLLRAYKKYLPNSFAEASLVCTAPLLGVRETRRIKGDYELTRVDYDERRRFDDDIAFNTFHIDIHPSLAKRKLEQEGKWSWRKEMDDSLYGKGEFQGIPYRCLLPVGVDNLLVAGRSISSDRETNSALRIMPTCMSMGEAAGIAAAFAAKESGKTREVSVSKVQDVIRQHGGFLPK